MFAFFGIGPIETIVIGIIVLGMLGGLMALVVVAVAATRRGRQVPMVGCLQCGRNVRADYAHCPNCGQALSQ